jgi:hypothetical protein
MYLDNALIERGDKVFDVVMGWGEVKSAKPDYCEVRFGPTIMVYREGGTTTHFRNKRTLYWNNPILVTPTKTVRRWGLMRKACKDLSHTILDYKGEDL